MRLEQPLGKKAAAPMSYPWIFPTPHLASLRGDVSSLQQQALSPRVVDLGPQPTPLSRLPFDAAYVSAQVQKMTCGPGLMRHRRAGGIRGTGRLEEGRTGGLLMGRAAEATSKRHCHLTAHMLIWPANHII